MAVEFHVKFAVQHGEGFLIDLTESPIELFVNPHACTRFQNDPEIHEQMHKLCIRRTVVGQGICSKAQNLHNFAKNQHSRQPDHHDRLLDIQLNPALVDLIRIEAIRRDLVEYDFV